MAVDPPYRLDPLQNPVNVKWGDGDGDGEPGSKDCWGLFIAQFINPEINPPTRWGLASGEGNTTDPGESAASFGFTIWYLDSFNVIVCYQWEWLVGTECGFAPGPNDSPPANVPDDWEGFNHSPNSEE